MYDQPPAGLTDEMLEDCLQALHRLELQGRPGRLEEIGAFARLPEETTRAVLVELRSRGLVVEGPGADPALTPEGQRLAAAVLRRHRLSERLFADVLGLPWDRVHEEAMRLEHALTPEAEARLASMLEHPETCPHGGPIPTQDGRMQAPASRTLDQVPAGASVWIQQIVDEGGDFLRYLASLGLLPQAEVRVEEVAPFGGPLLVRVGGARYALGRDVAGRIRVREDAEGAGPRRLRRRHRGG